MQYPPRKSLRQSLVCQICQIPFDKSDREETLVCKNMHIICLTCSKSIVNKNATCPFCRQVFFDDVKKHLSGQYDINHEGQRSQRNSSIRSSLIERPLIDEQASSDYEKRKRMKKIKIRVFFIIFFLTLGIIGLIVDIKMNSCSFWGSYIDCPFDEMYCCQLALVCIIFHEQCPTLSSLQTPLIYIVAVLMVISYILCVGAMTSLIKILCKK